MAFLRVLITSIVVFSNLALGSEITSYLERYSDGNISHDHGVNNPMSSCPPWRYREHNGSECVCGHGIHGIVECLNDGSVLLLTCHCMSYSDNGDGVVMGATTFIQK